MPRPTANRQRVPVAPVPNERAQVPLRKLVQATYGVAQPARKLVRVAQVRVQPARKLVRVA